MWLCSKRVFRSVRKRALKTNLWDYVFLRQQKEICSFFNKALYFCKLLLCAMPRKLHDWCKHPSLNKSSAIFAKYFSNTMASYISSDWTCEQWRNQSGFGLWNGQKPFDLRHFILQIGMFYFPKFISHYEINTTAFRLGFIYLFYVIVTGHFFYHDLVGCFFHFLVEQ